MAVVCYRDFSILSTVYCAKRDVRNVLRFFYNKIFKMETWDSSTAMVRAFSHMTMILGVAPIDSTERGGITRVRGLI